MSQVHTLARTTPRTRLEIRHSSAPEFKEQALLKARHRGTRSILTIAAELNISPGTLKRWVLDSAKAGQKANGTNLALDGPAAA